MTVVRVFAAALTCGIVAAACTEAAPAGDPRGPSDGTIKVEKGVWWGSNPIVARAAYRHYEDPPEYGDKHIGFRVVSDRTD